jgi:hypothetical protein
MFGGLVIFGPFKKMVTNNSYIISSTVAHAAIISITTIITTR